MRIISGRLGGRLIDAPHNNRTHPMSDKIRGALFNAIGDIGGFTVLDAFAGSGALAFEALSRGAAHATLIEHDRNAQTTIADNIELLGLTAQAKLIRAAVGPWLSTTNTTYDLVLSDPPYDRLQQNLIDKLALRVASGGLMVLSWPGHAAPPQLENIKQLERRLYGDAQLIFYRAD